MFGLGAELATSCPHRATAKDSLDSSYFKEKPLRKYIPHQPGLQCLASADLSLCLPSLRARAHAHLPPPSQQACSQHQHGDRDPGKACQALSPESRRRKCRNSSRDGHCQGWALAPALLLARHTALLGDAVMGAVTSWDGS